ncbi:Titin isoform N2B [Phytophthora megakarya]|uniref:[RNA-polymerase]-subunit kinase n=1 Tax=Phytophthora megakarya TaxID=4795 RepID=A0A225X253_9STRA|nr:Titin isoform N2B [Phytophthora megakarya]
MKILKYLKHPNIVDLKEIVSSSAPPKEGKRPPLYFAFEYMEHDLSGLLNHPRVKFTRTQIQCYMRQLLTGIAFMHRNKIIHRDIKASNLLLNNQGMLKVGDFGLSRFWNEVNAKAGRYTNKVVTLWYRPPELLMGSTSYDFSVDIWSIGCIFGELLLGKPILQGKTEIEQLQMIFGLRGMPTEETWPGFFKLPGAESFQMDDKYVCPLLGRFKNFPPHAVDLLEKLLQLDPTKRITAAEAMDHDYFWRVQTCKPRDLPKFVVSSTHEYQSKKRHHEEMAAAAAVNGNSKNSDQHRNSRQRERSGYRERATIMIETVTGAVVAAVSAGTEIAVLEVRSEFFTPEDVPGPPEKIFVSPASDTSMRVQFLPPLNVKPEGVNGAPVLGYKVEVARRVDEVQTFTVTPNGPILAGGYKMTFKKGSDAEVTSCIPWNASEVEFEMALEELAIVDSVGVSRSDYSAAKNGYVYTVTFDGAYLVSGEQTNLLTGDTTGCHATQPSNTVLSLQGARVTTGVAGFYPEIWEIVSTNTDTQVLGGTFDLSVGFEGAWTTVGITVDITAGSKTAKTHGSMLGRVNRGDRVRIDGEEFKVHATAPFTDFQLPLDSYHIHGATGATIEVMDTALGTVQVTNNLNAVTYSGDFRTGTPSIANGDQIRIGKINVVVSIVAAGTLTLASPWLGDSMLHITAFARKKTTLSTSAEAAEMKRALGALPGVGSIDVTRVGPSSLNGYHWFVTFQSLDSVGLRVDKTKGTTAFLDINGGVCSTCTVTASVVTDATQITTLAEIKGDYAASAIVASQEVGGVVAEVQKISTTATVNDISGSFVVSFQSVGGAVINFDDTAADVRTKLQALTTIGRLDITQMDNAAFGSTWTITFLSNMGDLPQIVITDSTLLKGTGVKVVVQEVVKGVDVAQETVIEGLVPGQDYFVRAFARNENGYGASTTDLQQRGRGALPLLTSVATSPDPPGITGMWPLSGSQMELRLSSTEDHGDPVSKYLFEYAVGDTFGTPSTKTLSIFDSVENDIAGIFRLQYGDDVTIMLPVHTTAISLQNALNNLPCMRPVSVARAVYVLTGEPASQVTKFVVSNNRLITTALSVSQCEMLVKGARINVGGYVFTVKVQPADGNTGVDVELGHGVTQDINNANMAVLKLDKSGSERGPYGYAWTISFDNDVESVVHGQYPGLQLLPSLTSVKTNLAITNCGIAPGRSAIPADHYGYFEINNDENVCDTYVVGAPSSVQVVRLFGPTTVTDGAFKLKLGSELTGCVALGKVGTPSTMKGMLENLQFVSKVTVEEVRSFKVGVLSGSTTSKVTDYDGSNLLTVVSTDTTASHPGGLTSAEIKVLLQYAIIRVSRNPNDFSRYSCEFVINTTPTVGNKQLSVTAVGSCASFTGEARSLKVLDFHDYNVRFWGHYPTGEWPTLQFDSTTFGTALCTPWAPQNILLYGQVHTVQYEGVCSQGQAGIQTILADGSSAMGGTFTLSYMGEVTSPLSFQTTGAGEMADAIDSITAPGTVSVSVSQYGSYGKAWHVTFAESQNEDQDALFVQHSRLTGQNALISVYPTVTVFTDAKRNDISGSFRITINGETTEPIGHSATHMKVIQELQKLTTVDSVVALGDKNAGDVGVYALKLTADATGTDPTLFNINLDGKTIDPTKFLAIGETLVVGSNTVFTIKSMTPVDITLTGNPPVLAAADVFVGLITKQTKPLPGYVGISPLMQVVAVSNGKNEFQLPADHGFSGSSWFYIGVTKFTVQPWVPGQLRTTIITDVPYTGETVVAGYPTLYLFDNRLQTTENLINLVAANDHVWLPSVSAEMKKFKVTAVDPKFLAVDGSFTDAIARTQAYQVSNGRKWNIVFRSYDGSLDTVDAIPEHDWRGTDARIGTRSPKAVPPNVINVGNPASTQTIFLEVANPGITTAYTLSFAGETILDTGHNPRHIPWATINDDLEAALDSLDSVDGVTVASLVNAGTVVHTISFWGTYPMKKLPLLVVVPDDLLALTAYVQGNDAVAGDKQGNLILESSQDYAFRIFAKNSRGTSDSISVFQAQTSASSVVPTPPTGVALGEFHGPTWLSVNYWAPIYSGGADVTMYRIEWDSSPSFDSSSTDYGVANIQETFEVQQVITSYRTATSMGGTFTLAWGGRKTSALPFDCSKAEMTDALAIITETSNIPVKPVDVNRLEGERGYTWDITFLHNHGDLAPLVADGRQLTGDAPRITVVELVQGFSDLAIGDFTHEVQEVYTDGVAPVGGSFTLTFHGKTTGQITSDASEMDMQAALQATTPSYSIKVTKAIRNAAINTAIWSVTFAYLRGEEMVGAGNIFTMTASSQLTDANAVVRVANKITGSDPFRFTLRGLRPGVKYYAHVMAYNAAGFGSATSPLASAVTCSQPLAPASVTASIVDGTSLAVDWSASVANGNLCSVDKYKVEWYRAEGTQEQQTITTSAEKGLAEIQRLVNFADSQSLGGYFKLSFGGEMTENIRWDAPGIGQNSVKERLERISTVGKVDVSRSLSSRVVSGLLVTCTGTTVTQHPTSASTIGTSTLKLNDVIWIAGNPRKITTAVVSSATTLTINETLQVTVPMPIFKSAFGYEWEITFRGGHVGPQELIKAIPSESWTGNNPGIIVDPICKGLEPISGTFRVAFSTGGLSDTTPPLPNNISASDMQIALENLVTIGAVNVTRSTNGYGYSWVVVFLSEFKNDISLLSVDGTELQGPDVRILAARTVSGVQPTFYCEREGMSGVPAEIGVPGKLHYVINGLSTGTKYAIRVRAHNSEGYGYTAISSPSFQIPRTTASAPQAVQLIALSSRLLKLQWKAPTNNGGTTISSYQVQWDKSADFTSPTQGTFLIAQADIIPFYFNIPVASGTKYYVRVFAVNEQGNGTSGIPSPSSIVPADRTPGRPEDATATVLSGDSILVNWKTSSTEKNYYRGDGGLPITQYMIEWDNSPRFDSPPAFALVDGTKRSYVIGGDDAATGVRSNVLIFGLTYSIRVTAFNAKGAGSPQPTTPPSVIVTDQPPSAPKNLKLSFMTATSVKADWRNPLYNGGESLKSYQIEWDEQENFSSGQMSSTTIPIVREMQSITLQNDVVNEEQFVDATVKVTNEEQVVRTTFSGVDEVQVIKTTSGTVTDEIQTVVTAATDRNEVQELRLDGDDVDEIQAIRTSVPEALEVQTLKVGVNRGNEVQTIILTIPGAFTNPSIIGGEIYFSFDSSICTHCVKKMYQRTTNLITALQNPGTAAAKVTAALISLANIDDVDVIATPTRGPDPTTGSDLILTFTITFKGLKVAGNVASLGIDAAVTVTVNGVTSAVPGLPTQATQTTPGKEEVYDSAATFTVTYTCESYSDPSAITSFSTACTPSTRICDGCVTTFIGGVFTVADSLQSDTIVVPGAKLVAGVCSFEAGTVTKSTSSTTITVAANDVGSYCSSFSGKAFALYKAKQMSTSIPLKTAATTVSSGNVVEGFLSGTIDSVTVARSEYVDLNFVGSVYTVTFRKRSGTLPLLLCTAAGTAICTVNNARSVVGSLITGTFQIGLVSEADATQTSPLPQYTGDIPWDASETDMKNALETVSQNSKSVFGTVTVKRTVFSPTGNKWSGGFTWQITFTNATHPLDPFANSRDGNQVMGLMMLKFRDVASTVQCEIGTNTLLDTLDVPVPDTALKAFFLTNLKINVDIMRSAATQARGFTWTITYSDSSTGGDVGSLQIVSSQLTGKNVRYGVYETMKGNQLGGRFQLSFNGATTGPIDFNAEASVVATELNRLETIQPSSVIVSRGDPTLPQVLGYTWYITFHSSVWADPTSDHSNGIAGNWKGTSRASWDDVWDSGYSKAWGRQVGHTFLLKCITDGLTTTTNDGSQSCLPAVATPGVGPIRGSFTISIDSTAATYAHMAVHSGVNAVATSGAIAHNAFATKEDSGYTGTSVEEIIESMSNVGDVAVSRDDGDDHTGGYTWTVTFLRDASDATHPCEQLEASAGSQLCNAPGNVPQMHAVGTFELGSSSAVSTSTILDGTILRGDFTNFRVQGDAGIAAKYSVSVTCTNAHGSGSCSVTSLTIKAGGDQLQNQLIRGDRITTKEFPSCIFQVDSVSPQTITVATKSCNVMDSANTGPTTWLGLNILLPWNADESLVERVLETAATNTGRKVSVQRSVHGKYGEMSWLIRFITNPTYTPPGAGNLPDITTTFDAEAGSSKYDVTVTQVTPGSIGLSGSFLLDFQSSSFGPREIFFDEDPDRLQRKLNEMDTIGRVTVKRIIYPSAATGCEASSCSGGWEGLAVQNPGTRGGYRWVIRFMEATGDYRGYTFPPGSGNVASLSVTRSSLKGMGVSVDVYTNVPGSSSTTGTFALNTSNGQTPSLPYSSSADDMKLGIEAMGLFGEVDVTQGYLLTQKIPGVKATLNQDGVTAAIAGVDIRQFIAPTDIIRFGSMSINNLAGTNGDAPFTGGIDTSQVSVTARSPVVIADADSTRLLYPGMQLRIDGLVYRVQRTGHEIQTITVTKPTSTWNPTSISNNFLLEMTRNGVTKPRTSCLGVYDDGAHVQSAIYGATTDDVLVSRVGPVTVGPTGNTRTGYVYTVYFVGETVSGDVASLKEYECTAGSLGDATVVVDVVTHGGKLPHQRLMLATDYGQILDTAGFFQIYFNSQHSACIKWGAPASDVEAALENNPLSFGDVIVTRSGNGTSQTEIQRIRMTANTMVTSTNGLFKVQFTLNGITSATSCLQYGISAAGLETALNGFANLGTLNNIHHIDVTRDGDGSPNWGYGYEYLIHFSGPISGGPSRVLGDIPPLVIGNVGTGVCSTGAQNGVYPALMVDTIRQGSPGFTYDIFFMNYKTAPIVNLMSLKTKDNGDNVCVTGWQSSGGSVRKAYVELVELGGSSEIQVLTIKDATATGYFVITSTAFGSHTSTCLTFTTVTASNIASELRTMTSSSNTGDILVSSDADFLSWPNGVVFRITFVGERVTGNIPLIGVVQYSDSSCTNSVATSNLIVVSGVDGGTPTGEFSLTTAYDGETPNTPHAAYSVSQQFSVLEEQFEIQQIVISNPGKSFVTGVTYYTLTVMGTTNTHPIWWDASETALQLELINTVRTALPTVIVGTSDIIVTRRTNADLAPNGFVYTIYFNGASVAGNVASIDVVSPTGANDIGPTNVIISTIRQGASGVGTLTATSIPLALPDDSTTPSQYLSSAVQQQLDVYKVNGFLWDVKFKSFLGNVPKLNKQTTTLSAGTITIQDDFVPGSASNSYIIPDLVSGVNYYARVAAWTDVGIGSFTPSSSIIPSIISSGVRHLASGYALYQREVQEIRLAASHIMEIQEITTEAARVAEVQTLRTFVLRSSCPAGNCVTGNFAFRVPTVQTVTIWSTATISGTFTLSFTREVPSGSSGTSGSPGTFSPLTVLTSNMNWNDDAATVQSALTCATINAALGSKDIVVTRDGDAASDFNYGYIFQITFVGNNVAGETQKMLCDGSHLAATGGATVHCDVSMTRDIAMGTDTCVQQVIVTADKPLTVGSYKLHFNYLGLDQISACIPFDASAKTMETILEGMPNIDNVFVTREINIYEAKNGFIYRIYFHGNGVYGNTPPLMWPNTDTGCAAFQTLENNVLTVVNNGKVIPTVLDYGGFDSHNTFVDAAHATATQLTADLNQLPVFGDVLVEQTLTDEQGGHIWTVAFEDSQGNLPQLICAIDPATFTATGSGCDTDTLTDGNVLSGSFLIESSLPIPFNADASTIKSALEATAWAGTVQVTQSDPSPQFGYTWTITFMDYNGDVPDLPITSRLVGTGNQIFVREVRKGNSLGGQFTLTYSSSVTDPINWNAPAMTALSNPDGSSMQEKLEDLDTVGQVNVVRTGPDEEGGYIWLVTFMDNVLNSGDLPLLQGNGSVLTGENSVIFTREVTKGSNAVGDQLWLSFDPPETDNGSPITKYQVRWDTSSDFTSNPTDVFITDADKLYRTQRVATSAPSLAWSSNMIKHVNEVQQLTILTMGTFSLSFRGMQTGILTAVPAGTTAGATTVASLNAALEALSSVGTVVCSSTKTLLEVDAVVLITFTTEPGNLPLLAVIPNPDTAASVVKSKPGTTNFRKEVIVFSCGATTGTIRFTYNGNDAIVDYNAPLTDVETSLLTLFGVEAESITVTSATPTVLCSSIPVDIKIAFDRVYGDINLIIAGGGINDITPNLYASIDGVYNDDPTLVMSGTFQMGYQGLYTRPLNAESSADQLRYALEDLNSIQTVGVALERSYRPLPGKVDVTEGEIFVTCSGKQNCNFYAAGYGLPGYVIRIGGDWYTVRTDLSSPGLHQSRLYLGDLNGREIGYLGSTDTAVTVYEWTKGYVWTVDMLSVSSPLSYMTAKVPRLHPGDSTVSISGSACDKCYYLPTQTTKKLTMGQQYYIEAYAYNMNGKGSAPIGGWITATPMQVVPSHGCAIFNGQSYPLYYYTYSPKVISGPAIQGTPPFRYVISSLTPGKNYYVRVAAVNMVSVQQIALSGEPPDNRKWSYTLSAITADRAPDPPLSVYLNPLSGSSLELQIQPSTRDGKGSGGTGITAFWIDVDTVSTFDSSTKNAAIEVLTTSILIPELYSGGPRIYHVTGLTTGTRYFAQVKAVNTLGGSVKGYSRATIAPVAQTPTRHPNGPASVKVSTLTISPTPITSATATWQTPADTGGQLLTGYKVEWWRPASRPEIQTVELKWTTQPTAAPFTLSFGGLTTSPLPMDISADNLRFELMSLASATTIPIGNIEISRSSVNIVQGYQWTITFDNLNVNPGNQPLLQFYQDPLAVVGSTDAVGRVFVVQSGIAPAGNIFPGKQEVQVLVTYYTSVVGGYFRLSFKGSAWTNYLSATISGADLKLALEALPTISVVTVNSETMLLSGAAWTFGQVWTITFESNVGNQPPLIVDSSKITPAAAFVGVKDGDNAVSTAGSVCLPDGTSGCPGSWPGALKNLKQQVTPAKSIAQLAAPGEAAVGYGFYETIDTSTVTYTITGLTPGNSYLVSVAAKNARGLGVRTQSSPVVVIPPLQVPGLPVNVSADVNPGVSTQLVVSWAAPASDGGSPVWMYRLEYDVSPLFTARGQQDQYCPVAQTPAVWLVQTMNTNSLSTDPVTSGYFTLKLRRNNIVEESDPIPWDAVAEASDEANSVTALSSGVFCTSTSSHCAAAQLQKSGSIQSKFSRFSQLNNGVTVTRSAQASNSGYTWTITFLDGSDDFTLTAGSVNLACASSCTGTYNILPSVVRHGVLPSPCTGNFVIPSSGVLNKGQLYYVRVFAYNQIGFGGPQLAAAPQKPMVAPGAPTGVTLTVQTVSALIVAFNPPDDNGGDTVTGYEVQWATDPAFTSPSSNPVQFGKGVSAPYKHTIPSLIKGTRYYVRIRARNSQGPGMFQISSPVSQQPYTTPSSPTQVVLGITSSTMLTVGWAAPTDDGGDTVSGYVVQWDVVATFNSLATGSTTAVINDATQRSYTITLLTPGTRYYVRVFAMNQGGKGAPQTSAPASMIPATTRPGKPNSLAAAPTSTAGQLQIVWQPPRVPAHGIPCAGTLQAPQSCPVLLGLDMVFGGVSLESYLVQYASSSDFSLATEVSVTTTSAALTGLVSNQVYYIRVLTVNSQGLNSDFCVRKNSQGLLCPDHLVLEDGSVATGDFVFAAPT